MLAALTCIVIQLTSDSTFMWKSCTCCPEFLPMFDTPCIIHVNQHAHPQDHRQLSEECIHPARSDSNIKRFGLKLMIFVLFRNFTQWIITCRRSERCCTPSAQHSQVFSGCQQVSICLQAAAMAPLAWTHNYYMLVVSEPVVLSVTLKSLPCCCYMRVGGWLSKGACMLDVECTRAK